MEDMIIKGTGNSRWLKSVANIMTLYPTYESFAEALAAGTFPIDLNGINPAGVETPGTRLNKANLLTDALCTALGLATTATPTQAMDKLRMMVTGKTNIYTASHTGNDKYGASNPCSLTFPFAPTYVLLMGYSGKNSSDNIYWVDTIGRDFNGTLCFVPNMSTNFAIGNGGFSINTQSGSYSMKSNDGKTIYWYNSQGPVYQCNAKATTYHYMVIG